MSKDDVIIGTWNHRIVKDKYDNGEIYYGIYEVFYDKGGEPDGYTEKPMDVTGDSLEDLKEYYEMMAGAFKQPILEEKHFKE